MCPTALFCSWNGRGSVSKGPLLSDQIYNEKCTDKRVCREVEEGCVFCWGVTPHCCQIAEWEGILRIPDFFLIQVRFPPPVGREAHVTPPTCSLQNSLQPNFLALYRCKWENFMCTSLPKVQGFTAYKWHHRRMSCLPQRQTNLTDKVTFFRKSYWAAL